jgi:hypothetical protein
MNQKVYVRSLNVVLLMTAAMLSPIQTDAFDGKRHGFLLGFGAGYGSAEDPYGTESGVATSFVLHRPRDRSSSFSGEVGYGARRANRGGRDPRLTNFTVTLGWLGF